MKRLLQIAFVVSVIGFFAMAILGVWRLGEGDELLLITGAICFVAASDFMIAAAFTCSKLLDIGSE
jgi:hypothetical protein